MINLAGEFFLSRWKDVPERRSCASKHITRNLAACTLRPTLSVVYAVRDCACLTLLRSWVNASGHSNGTFRTILLQTRHTILSPRSGRSCTSPPPTKRFRFTPDKSVTNRYQQKALLFESTRCHIFVLQNERCHISVLIQSWKIEQVKRLIFKSHTKIVISFITLSNEGGTLTCALW